MQTARRKLIRAPCPFPPQFIFWAAAFWLWSAFAGKQIWTLNMKEGTVFDLSM
jgi:hypothetical protein